MKTKDLNILCKKIETSANKKDIAVVSGYNSYVQKIENVCRVQENEIPSFMSLGVNYYDYIFNPVGEKTYIQMILSKSIKAAIPELVSTSTNIVFYDQEKLTIEVSFTTNSNSKNQKSLCRIEVKII